MEEPKVRMFSPFQVALTYPSLPNFILRMNFEPLFGLSEVDDDCTLLHWQAKPKGLRRWGAFTKRGDKTRYQTFLSYRSECPYQRGLQLDETETIFLPTAVIWFPQCDVRVEGTEGVIGKFGTV